ncbi:MAG: hypothetical protein AVDCRST_MAG85-83, partial [uncultured Solirubrobacteraceae bacterium]
DGGQAAADRRADDRLLAGDARRHGALRRRAVARTGRGVQRLHVGPRDAVAGRGARRPAGVPGAPGRRDAAGPGARGRRVHRRADRHGHVRRLEREPRVAGARRGRDRAADRARRRPVLGGDRRRDDRAARRARRCHRPLRAVLAPRREPRPLGPRLEPRRDRAGPFARADRAGVLRRPLLHAVRVPGAGPRPARVGPVRRGLGPVRHRRPPHRLPARLAERDLGGAGHGDRRRPRRGARPRARPRARAQRRPPRGGPLAVADARADGRAHRGRFVVALRGDGGDM